MIGRRELLGATGALALADGGASPAPRMEWPSPEGFPLWPGRPPGARETLPRYQTKPEGGQLHVSGIATPRVDIYRAARPDGRALLVCPGGGYQILSVTNEGIDAARRFGADGITVAVLSYRLPGEGWEERADVPLQDAQRAMRLLRARARELGFDPERLGVLGFSAGGHVAATLATDHAQQVYAAVDEADGLSARPWIAGLMYPVISMVAGITHQGSRDTLLGTKPTDAAIRRRTASLQVTGRTPPCFIGHAADDTIVPIRNSLDMFAACRGAAVPTEAHFFTRGGHGFGFGAPPGTSIAVWPTLFERWTREFR